MSLQALDLHIHLAGAGGPGPRRDEKAASDEPPAEASVLSKPSQAQAAQADVQEAAAGCWFHPRRLRAPGFRVMLWSLGISRREARTRLGTALRARLVRALEGAPSLSAGVVLALDWARDEAGEPRPDLTDFYVPNDYVLALAGAHEKVRAGVSVHPLRADAAEELHRCARAGAVLVKWLPTAQNFAPDDPRAAPFLAELARLGMPLLCHTGSEGATRNLNKAWNDPRRLRAALDAGVTVIAAHAGMRSFFHEPDHMDAWVGLCADYPHLYGDTASLFGLRARHLIRALDRPYVVDRLVHGSDWPVPASPWWFLGRVPVRRIRALARVESPLERDLRTKRALGLPQAVFTRGHALLYSAQRPSRASS